MEIEFKEENSKATHYHPDHIGLISQLMELGVRLILIDKQREYVHFSDFRMQKKPRGCIVIR